MVYPSRLSLLHDRLHTRSESERYPFLSCIPVGDMQLSSRHLQHERGNSTWSRDRWANQAAATRRSVTSRAHRPIGVICGVKWKRSFRAMDFSDGCPFTVNPQCIGASLRYRFFDEEESLSLPLLPLVEGTRSLLSRWLAARLSRLSFSFASICLPRFSLGPSRRTVSRYRICMRFA